MAALRESATKHPSLDQWHFPGGPYHREQDALDITEACLMLGVPVSDVISGRAWLILLRRLADIEKIVRAQGEMIGRLQKAETVRSESENALIETAAGDVESEHAP